LRLRSNSIADEGGEVLAESLMSVTSLLVFDIAQNKINVQTAAVMLRATCAARRLEKLQLDSNLPWPTSDSHEVHIAAFTDQLSGLQAVPSLQTLSLRRCGLQSNSACKLFESLATNSTLRKLDVSCNGMRQSAAPKIAAALACQSNGLEELDLRDNRLGAQDAIAFAFQQVCGVELSLLDAGTLRPAATLKPEESPEAALGQSMAYNRCLRVLNLANNEITAEASCRLAHALPFLNSLEELLLYHNPMIGDTGAQALATLLKPDSWKFGNGLKVFSLAACGIGDEGCQALMGMIGEHKALQSLDLSCNAITDDSTPAISTVLAQADSSLESLMLSMNSISSSGISKLMDSVALNPDGALCEIDVATQESGQKQSNIEISDPISPRSSSKVKAKFHGLH